MDQNKRLLTNTVVNLARRPIMVVITVFLTPFILHHLGRDVYGIWALTGATLGYIGLLKLGLNSAVDLHIPKLTEQRDGRGINTVVNTVLALYAIAALIATVLLTIVVWEFPYWFKIPPDLHVPARIVAGLVGGGFVLHIPLSAFFGLMAGIQRYDVTVGFTLSFNIFRAILVVILLGAGMGLISLAAVTVACEIAAALCIVAYAFRLCTPLKLAPRFISWRMAPGLMTYGLSTLMYASGSLLLLQGGKTLVGALYGPSAVTDFAIPLMLLVMFGQMVSQGLMAIKPVVSKFDAQDKRSSIQMIFILSTKYTLMIVLPATAFLLLHGDDVLKAWVGEEFAETGAVLLLVMTVPQMLRAANTGGFLTLSGLGWHRVGGALTLSQALTGLALGYLLAEPLGLGLLGVGLGISIPEFIGSGLVFPVHCCRTLGLRLSDEIKQCLLPALVATIPFFVYWIAVPLWLSMETRGEFLIVSALSGVPLLSGIWFLGLDRAERGRFRGYMMPAAKGIASK